MLIYIEEVPAQSALKLNPDPSYGRIGNAGLAQPWGYVSVLFYRRTQTIRRRRVFLTPSTHSVGE